MSNQVKPTLEDLVKAGMTPEDARKYLETIYEGEQDITTLPFEVIKLNHDADNILADNGVERGGWIYGYELNRKTFEVIKQGTRLDTFRAILLKHTAFFEVKAPGNQDGYWTTPFSVHTSASKAMVADLGKTVEQLKAMGYQTTYYRLQLLLVETDDGWKPFVTYIKGVSFNQFLTGLEKLGLSSANLPQTIVTIGTTQVVTKHGKRVLALDLVDAEPAPIDVIVATAQTGLDATDKFNEYVDGKNKSLAGGNVADSEAGSEVPTQTQVEDAEGVL